MPGLLQQVHVTGIHQDIAEILDDQHQVVVGPSEGQWYDAGCASDTAIGDIKHNWLLHTLKIIVEFDVYSRKLMSQECRCWKGIMGSDIFMIA